jgi:hypothetical protein
MQPNKQILKKCRISAIIELFCFPATWLGHPITLINKFVIFHVVWLAKQKETQRT